MFDRYPTEADCINETDLIGSTSVQNMYWSARLIGATRSITGAVFALGTNSFYWSDEPDPMDCTDDAWGGANDYACGVDDKPSGGGTASVDAIMMADL